MAQIENLDPAASFHRCSLEQKPGATVLHPALFSWLPVSPSSDDGMVRYPRYLLAYSSDSVKSQSRLMADGRMDGGMGHERRYVKSGTRSVMMMMELGSRWSLTELLQRRPAEQNLAVQDPFELWSNGP